jgi:transposase-like protein
MLNCKGCGCDKLVKNGKSSYGVQRYKCKECGNSYGEGDKRLKHGLEKRLKVIKMYLEGVGIRSIERLEGVSNPLIIYWIRHFSTLIRKELRRRTIPDTPRDIEILEIDELFTYYKKRPTERMYGLLLTETETRLLISK